MDIVAGRPVLGFEERNNLQWVLQREQLTQDIAVQQFEQEFARYIGVEHAVAANNGTAALHLALLALGISRGDEVIVPATTFVATINAVTYTGATPVIVDVDPETWCMDPTDVENALTSHTKALLPVHLYGVPADMAYLQNIADAAGLFVIEDAAEALGATFCARKVGSIGDLGTFSFYGNKTITTGEGGMVTTRDPDVANRLRLYRGQGQTPGTRYWHEVVGYNYRMTEMQGAIGMAQMIKLPDLLRERERVVSRYRRRLGHQVQFQRVLGGSVHGNWAAAIVTRVPASEMIAKLAACRIESRPIFPPMHHLPMYRDGLVRPVAEWLYAYGLVLPTHPQLTEDELDRVASVVLEVLND